MFPAADVYISLFAIIKGELGFKGLALLTQNNEITVEYNIDCTHNVKLWKQHTETLELSRKTVSNLTTSLLITEQPTPIILHCPYSTLELLCDYASMRFSHVDNFNPSLSREICASLLLVYENEQSVLRWYIFQIMSEDLKYVPSKNILVSIFINQK